MTACTVCGKPVLEDQPGYVTLADGSAMHVACYDALPQYQVRHLPHGEQPQHGEETHELRGHHGYYGRLAVRR